MKGHHRKHHASGGKAESPKEGTKEWEEDLKDNPKNYGASNHVSEEAEEKKHGGHVKRHKRKHEAHAKGHKPHAHAGRMPRKSGGRTGSNFSPLSSAHSGTNPHGHSTPGAKD